MTERERLLAVLSGGEPDRTPWYADLSWWHSARLRSGDLPNEFADAEAGYLRMHREAGAGIYLYAPFMWRAEYDESVSTSSVIDDGVTTTVHATPVGEIRGIAREMPDSGTSAIVEHFVKSPADLAVVRYMMRHRRVRADYASFEACDRRWASDGAACVLAPVCTSGLQSLLTRWAGVETTVDLLHSDACAEVEETIEAMQQADDPVFDAIAAGPGTYVEFPDNLSGEVTGVRLARRHALGYWRRRIEQLHASGKIVGIHNDGTVRGMLPVLADAGFDFVEALTPAPVGDMPIEDIRDSAHAPMVVWGGLPGAMFSPTTPADAFEAHVRSVLAAFPCGSRFVLGVADQVPPDADFGRVRRVHDLVERYGR